jgi:hypothetical protein
MSVETLRTSVEPLRTSVKTQKTQVKPGYNSDRARQVLRFLSFQEIFSNLDFCSLRELFRRTSIERAATQVEEPVTKIETLKTPVEPVENAGRTPRCSLQAKRSFDF